MQYVKKKYQQEEMVNQMEKVQRNDWETNGVDWIRLQMKIIPKYLQTSYTVRI